MKSKVPYWIKFAIVFTIVIAVLLYIDIATADSLEFGSIGMILVTAPAMFLLESIGLVDLWWLLLGLTMIFVFAVGSLLGIFVQKFVNRSGKRAKITNFIAVALIIFFILMMMSIMNR